MKITLVYAQTKDCAIGYSGNKPLPWNYPEDLTHFVQVTRGKPMIMGMSTFESLPCLLPGRFHHVLTRKKSFLSLGRTDRVMFHASLDDALNVCLEDMAEEVCLIGGASVIAEGMGVADTIHRTVILNKSLEGDLAVVPEIPGEFECVNVLTCPTNPDLVFQTFKRIPHLF